MIAWVVANWVVLLIILAVIGLVGSLVFRLIGCLIKFAFIGAVIVAIFYACKHFGFF